LKIFQWKTEFQRLNFACFGLKTGKITVLMKEHVILPVLEPKQAKFKSWNFESPMEASGIGLDLPEILRNAGQ
jgi:hypothetical protein